MTAVATTASRVFDGIICSHPEMIDARYGPFAQYVVRAVCHSAFPQVAAERKRLSYRP
jgi:hypothetical protein